MWFFYALASALFASIRRTSEKQLSHKLNHFTIGWSVQLAALPILFMAALFVGPMYNPLTLGAKFWWPTIAIWVGFYPLNTFLYINAFKHGELSKILPLSSLGPVLSLLLAWAFAGQQPSILATLGVVTIAAGIYVLNMTGRTLHNPLSMFSKDKANLYTLLGLLMVSAATVLDKRAITASGPLFYSFVSTAGAVVALYIAAKATKVQERTELRAHAKPLLQTGLLFGLSYGAYGLAIASGPLAYVTAIRSGSAILFGSFLATRLIKETFTVHKAAALLLVLAGSALLIFS